MNEFDLHKGKEELNSAFEDVKGIKQEFTTTVEKISVEIIGENEESIIEEEVDLGHN